ncbi:hypothetical protein B0T11DRAFT_325244 [Plectosphaerella cucumerina]|uniref:Uncharacterized protein n=1 Tax=Plectosphaerella cucumerina TaxID=40658 RepID=A0A8K0TJY2_9PEZI|nr:hypothetical protein B0T11DRAFT_325244 [Plectosphaerella cucumerina]
MAQWLSLITGPFTIAVGINIISTIPRSTSGTPPLCGIKPLGFLAAQERRILDNQTAPFQTTRARSFRIESETLWHQTQPVGAQK